MARHLEFAGQTQDVPETRVGFVRRIQDALRMRDFEVAQQDAFAAWSAYSKAAGFVWVRVPDDTYEVLLHIRPYLRGMTCGSTCDHAVV